MPRVRSVAVRVVLRRRAVRRRGMAWWVGRGQRREVREGRVRGGMVRGMVGVVVVVVVVGKGWVEWDGMG